MLFYRWQLHFPVANSLVTVRPDMMVVSPLGMEVNISLLQADESQSMIRLTAVAVEAAANTYSTALLFNINESRFTFGMGFFHKMSNWKYLSDFQSSISIGCFKNIRFVRFELKTYSFQWKKKSIENKQWYKVCY